MSLTTCCVQNCLISVKDGVTLHRFPKPKREKNQFLAWIKCIGGEIAMLEHGFLYKNRRVCHKHFEPIYCGEYDCLRKDAIPTLHMPDLQSNIEIGSPRESKHDLSGSGDAPSMATVLITPAVKKVKPQWTHLQKIHLRPKKAEDPPPFDTRYKKWYWAPDWTLTAEKAKTRKFTRALIDAVRKHRCIYDKSHLNYGCRAILAKAWRSVLEELREVSNGDVNKLKIRWAGLRRNYLMHKRAYDPLLCTPTDRYYMKWPWAPYLTFLDPFVTFDKNETKYYIKPDILDESSDAHESETVEKVQELSSHVKTKIEDENRVKIIFADEMKIDDVMEIEDDVKIKHGDKGNVKDKDEPKVKIVFEDEIKIDDVMKTEDDVKTKHGDKGNVKNKDEPKVKIVFEDEIKIDDVMETEDDVKIKHGDKGNVKDKDEPKVKIVFEDEIKIDDVMEIENNVKIKHEDKRNFKDKYETKVKIVFEDEIKFDDGVQIESENKVNTKDENEKVNTKDENEVTIEDETFTSSAGIGNGFSLIIFES